MRLTEVFRPDHCYERLDEGEYESSGAKHRMRVLHDEALARNE